MSVNFVTAMSQSRRKVPWMPMVPRQSPAVRRGKVGTVGAGLMMMMMRAMPGRDARGKIQRLSDRCWIGHSLDR
jgi:hypothetical protein